MKSVRLISILGIAIGLAQVCPANGATTDCGTCHTLEAEQFSGSVHAGLQCLECHGGEASYPLSPAEAGAYRPRGGAAGQRFDHGPSFRGQPARTEIPERCGGCHADVVRMNPYGLRTDQLARYWTSGHGKTLKAKGDENVAVCVDCHGTHGILPAANPDSRTHPFNVPGTCALCHADRQLMAEYGLPVAEVEEYRRSVHGRLLFEQQDTGAPTCATCHGNHSAMPPGFASVGAVCAQCHRQVEKYFSETIHAEQSQHKVCLQCHGGGEGRHNHLIERITDPAGIMVQRYRRLLSTEPDPTPGEATEAIHPEPRMIMARAMSTCTDCHDELEDDEDLQAFFGLLDEIAEAERHYVATARRLDEVGRGVLLVENQRFKFEDAKTHLIGLAPLQHTLDGAQVAEEIAQLKKVCDEVDAELTKLEAGLSWRHRALVPLWVFCLSFAVVLYVKYKRLHGVYVKPLSNR